MKVNTITSPSNSTLKCIRALHRRQARQKEKLFLLEGPHCLNEAVQKGLELQVVVASFSYLAAHAEELAGLGLEQVTAVDDRIFSGLSTTASGCGVLAAAMVPGQDQSNLDRWRPRIVAVADAIQDPGNLGTLVRTAYAAGIGGLLVLGGSVDPYNPKVVRSAAGALFALPVLYGLSAGEALELIAACKLRLVVCEASATKRYFESDLADSVAIVLGNEGQGISAEIKAAACESISIPMHPGAESLNVAISGGIILFETLKQRLSAGKK